MGVNIKDLLVRKEIKVDDLKNKVLVVDTFNVLYQFLTTIRQRDGSLLTDSNNNVTSHLIGLFSRTSSLMQSGLKLAFVFDGEPPELKRTERERRKKQKQEAKIKYDDALEKKDLELMKKYAARTTRLTGDMINEAKELIHALGLPVIQAPSEGEAQAAHIVRNKDAFASISQDYDSLLFGTPKLIHNLTLSGRKKMPNRLHYKTICPEMIDLKENLTNLGLSQDQLIALGILVGTDFNPKGIKGIGPKNALKLVRKYPKNFETLFDEVKWSDSFDFSWKEVFDLVKNIKVSNKYDLEFVPFDKDKIFKLLVEKHDFSEERVLNTLEKLSENKQKDLNQWF